MQSRAKPRQRVVRRDDARWKDRAGRVQVSDAAWDLRWEERGGKG